MSKAAVMETNEQGTALRHAASGPQRLVEFLKETREEIRKVNTPTREEVQNGTVVVVATVFVFAAYFWLVDLVIGNGIDKVFTYLTKH